MKKVDTMYYCDDCGVKSRVEMNELSHEGGLTSTERHICATCIDARVGYSLKLKPLGSHKCDRCSGTGSEEEPDGVHGDSTTKTCRKCHGKGRQELEVPK